MSEQAQIVRLAKPGQPSCRMSVREMPDFICDLEPHDQSTQHRDLHGRRWDWSDDDIRVERVYETLSCTEVSLMPEGMPERHHFTIEVKRTAPGRFAVRWRGDCLSRGWEWDYEHIPSERTDDWLAQHRFSYDEAMQHAREMAPKLKVNGRTVGEWMAYVEANKAKDEHDNSTYDQTAGYPH